MHFFFKDILFQIIKKKTKFSRKKKINFIIQKGIQFDNTILLCMCKRVLGTNR